ncbi:hypothetical protein [Halorussus caseinilyticus]|uniref:Uncharacterized protein n=1 Tax=Halorussus caseinilyticus TaxID=3034025 RepID=A0ABD5WRK4_9EURY|nr:hypothetical protein [Halorussus sp. DT72]
MGLFGDDREGGYEYDEEYVSRIVENAEDGTVTAEVLTKTDSKRFFSGSGYLHDQSLLAHLDADEQPHYVFHNDEAGVITTSDGTRLEPDANYRTIGAFTDRRLVLLVGRESGDEQRAVAYDDVVGFHAKNDNGRFVVETDDEGYVFDVHEPLDEEHLLDLIEFLIFHTDIEAWDFPDDWRRGIQRRRVKRLGSRAEGTFNIDALEALLAPLGDDEQPHYLLPASSVTVGRLENAYKPIERVVVTDQRILVNGEDETYDLTDFEADEDVTLETSIPFHLVDWIEGRSRDGESGTLVVRRTWGPVCRVRVPEPDVDEVIDAIRYVQRQILTSRIDYDDVDPLEWIEQLGKLNRAGYIEDEVFEAKKRSLLDDS